MKERLRDLRKILKLNQSNFAARIGMAQTSYSQIETGLITITEKNIKLICLIFGVNEEWLRNGKGEMFCEKSPLQTELFSIFDELEPNLQDTLISYAKGLLDAQHTIRNESSIPE